MVFEGIVAGGTPATGTADVPLANSGPPVVVPPPSTTSIRGATAPEGAGHVETTVQAGGIAVTYSQTVNYMNIFQGSPSSLPDGVTAGASSFNTFRTSDNPSVTLVSDTATAPGDARNQGAAGQ